MKRLIALSLLIASAIPADAPIIAAVAVGRSQYPGLDSVLPPGDVTFVYITHPGSYFRITVNLTGGGFRQAFAERPEGHRVLSWPVMIQAGMRVANVVVEPLNVTDRLMTEVVDQR